MRSRGIVELVVCAWMVTLALSGCTGGAGMPEAAVVTRPLLSAHPAWWREAPAAARAGVYVSQANGSFDGVIFGFTAGNRRNDPPVCSIEGQKFADSQIATDPAGNLYVPNIVTASVNIYAPGCGKLIASVADPYGAAVDAVFGGTTIYAAGGATVAVCTPRGCTSALTDPSIFQLETAAVDSAGNVWVSYYSQKGAITLIVWPNGSMPGRVVSGYVNQNTPGDLMFDRNGTLVSLQTRFSHVYTYRCNAATAACTNTGTFDLRAGSLFGALNRRNTNFQVSDYVNHSVDVYAYPSFAYQYSYSRGLLPNDAVEGIVQTR
jgi:hypothetical protein